MELQYKHSSLITREHRPLPNASIIELRHFFPDPYSDADRHQNLTTWPLGHAIALQEISSKSVHNFFSYPSAVIRWKFGLGENWGRSSRVLTPNEVDLTFWVPDYGAKFHQNRATIATVGGLTDRQWDRQNRQTDKQTKVKTQPPSSAEVISFLFFQVG